MRELNGIKQINTIKNSQSKQLNYQKDFFLLKRINNQNNEKRKEILNKII